MYYLISIILGLLPEVLYFTLFLIYAKDLKEKKLKLFALITIAYTITIFIKHELMHIWLYENGHKNQYNNEMFSYEDLCEYVALSNDSINRITRLYLKSKNL